MVNLINKESWPILDLLRRIKKKDFSGNKGQAIKNSSYSFGTTIISITASIITFLVAEKVVLIYGKSFLPAALILKIFSLLLIVVPLIGLYETYFSSREKVMVVSSLVILFTLINIILN